MIVWAAAAMVGAFIALVGASAASVWMLWTEYKEAGEGR